MYNGVPQGSVLGPILFTLYVNDMPNATSAKPRLFADDTWLFSFHANIEKLSLSINEELNMLNEWLKANKLLVNTSKTNFSIFVPSKTVNSLLVRYQWAINLIALRRLNTLA